MKLGKTIIIVTLALTKLSTAQALTCKTQLIHTLCGSGKVEISIDKITKQFVFKNGDVQCWFMDYQVKGTIEKIEGKYPFNHHETLQLLISDTETKQSINYAKLVYDDQLKVASLFISKGSNRDGRINTKYDLSCNDQ